MASEGRAAERVVTTEVAPEFRPTPRPRKPGAPGAGVRAPRSACVRALYGSGSFDRRVRPSPAGRAARRLAAPRPLARELASSSFGELPRRGRGPPRPRRTGLNARTVWTSPAEPAD